MASEHQTGVPCRGGDEYDAFSRLCRRVHTSLQRPGVAKAAKRAFNRRVRKTPILPEDS